MTHIHIETDRLIIRPSELADAAVVNAAIQASAVPLRAWMPWANPLPTVEQTTEYLRGAIERTTQDKEYHLHVFTREGIFVGCNGLHTVDWRIPRAEIGYWLDQRHTGRGYAQESAAALTDFATTVMGLRRIQILVSDKNHASWRIPERLGYPLEGIHRWDRINPDGQRDHTRVYAIINDNPKPAEPWGQIHRRACGMSPVRVEH